MKVKAARVLELIGPLIVASPLFWAGAIDDPALGILAILSVMGIGIGVMFRVAMWQQRMRDETK